MGALRCVRDPAYEARRDALIPEAEAYAKAKVKADDREGDNPYYTRVFMRRMDEMAREIGLVTSPKRPYELPLVGEDETPQEL